MGRFVRDWRCENNKKPVPDRDTKIDTTFVADEHLAYSIVLRLHGGVYCKVWVRGECLLHLGGANHCRAADFDINPFRTIRCTTKEECEATQEGMWKVHLGEVIREQCGNKDETLWGWWGRSRHGTWHCIQEVDGWSWTD